MQIQYPIPNLQPKLERSTIALTEGKFSQQELSHSSSTAKQNILPDSDLIRFHATGTFDTSSNIYQFVENFLTGNFSF